jgi:Activator of Hsp90 ATPase homolog 1-like protein
MTTTTSEVSREVTVPGTPERAFDLFTNHMIEWWPAEHHVATAPVVAMTAEPHVGGRVFDTCEDGSESVWGQVTEWDPPSRFGFAWMLSATWEIETDAEKASRVTVSFTADGPNTRVGLVHNEFWRLGEGGHGMAEAVGAPDGWQGGLKRFAEYVAR